MQDFAYDVTISRPVEIVGLNTAAEAIAPLPDGITLNPFTNIDILQGLHGCFDEGEAQYKTTMFTDMISDVPNKALGTATIAAAHIRRQKVRLVPDMATGEKLGLERWYLNQIVGNQPLPCTPELITFTALSVWLTKGQTDTAAKAALHEKLSGFTSLKLSVGQLSVRYVLKKQNG